MRQEEVVGFLAKGSACACAIEVTILMQHFYPSLCTCACASVCSAFSFLLVVAAGSFKQMIVDVVVAVCLPHRSFMLALAAHQVVGHLRSNIYKDDSTTTSTGALRQLLRRVF